MRSLGWFVAVLMAVGWIASEWPASAEKNVVKKAATWRRTASGWENSAEWNAVPPSAPAVHPLALAAVIVCFSAAGIAFASDSSQSSSRSKESDAPKAHPLAEPHLHLFATDAEPAFESKLE